MLFLRVVLQDGPTTFKVTQQKEFDKPFGPWVAHLIPLGAVGQQNTSETVSCGIFFKVLI